jgi:hypothetical protein
VQQRDAGRAVGVVLDRRDRRGDAVLVATEVDDAVLALVATTPVPAGDAAVHVAPRLLGSGASSDFSGSDRVIVAKSLTEAPRRAGEVGLYLRMAMVVPRGCRRGRAGLEAGVEQLDLVARGDGDDGALGVGALAHDPAAALALALPVHGVHAEDLDVEDGLDGLLDLGLVRPRSTTNVYLFSSSSP